MRLNKYQKFAKAVVECGTIKAAAKECKISTVTGYRWAKKPEVVDYTRKVKKAKMDALSAYITETSHVAVSTIEGIMTDTKINAQTRLQASMFIIKTGYDRLDVDDLEKRIEALERTVSDQ